MSRSKVIEQYVPHDESVWHIVELRKGVLRRRTWYGVKRNGVYYALSETLESAKQVIRDDLAIADVQVPRFLLTREMRDFLIHSGRYFGWSDLNNAGMLDLIRYGWIELIPWGGNFRKVPEK